MCEKRQEPYIVENEKTCGKKLEKSLKNMLTMFLVYYTICLAL